MSGSVAPSDKVLMKRPTVVLLAAGATLSGALMQPNAEAASGPDRPKNASQQRPGVDQAMQARAKFGLRRDESYVRGLDKDSDVPVNPRTGFPMTDDESRNLNARDAIGRASSTLTADLQAMSGDRFGGMYLDQGAGGHAVLWLSDPTADERVHISNRLPANAVVDYRRPEFSYRQLQLDDASASAQLAGLLADGVPVTSGRLSLPDNRVIVTVTRRLTDAELQRVQQLGPSVVVKEGSAAGSKASRRSGDVAAYGGRLIRGPREDCTSAISAHNGTSYYVITAGHCGKPNDAWTMGDIAPTANIGVGRLKNQYYQQTRTACDCQLVGPIAAGFSTTGVIVNGSGGIYYYNSATPATADDYYIGRPACVSGYETALVRTAGGIRCGTVHGTTYYVEYRPDGTGPVTVDGQIWLPNTEALYEGDSGAPFGDGPTFLGVEQGGDDTYDQFSRATLIEKATDGAPLYGFP